MKMTKQSGFTLIELVMVIVILGILAAVALPKFVDLKTDASKAAAQGVAGALGAASSINKAVRNIGTSQGSAIANCSTLEGLLDGGMPSGYSVTAGTITAGATASCTVSGPNSSSATFIGHGIA